MRGDSAVKVFGCGMMNSGDHEIRWLRDVASTVAINPCCILLAVDRQGSAMGGNDGRRKDVAEARAELEGYVGIWRYGEEVRRDDIPWVKNRLGCHD